jgi:hypothetical protein
MTWKRTLRCSVANELDAAPKTKGARSCYVILTSLCEIKHAKSKRPVDYIPQQKNVLSAQNNALLAALHCTPVIHVISAGTCPARARIRNCIAERFQSWHDSPNLAFTNVMRTHKNKQKPSTTCCWRNDSQIKSRRPVHRLHPTCS